MYMTQKEKKEKLHMINKIFFVLSSRDSVGVGEKGKREKGKAVGCVSGGGGWREKGQGWNEDG